MCFACAGWVAASSHPIALQVPFSPFLPLSLSVMAIGWLIVQGNLPPRVQPGGIYSSRRIQKCTRHPHTHMLSTRHISSVHHISWNDDTMTHAIDSSHSMGGRMVTPPEHFELRSNPATRNPAIRNVGGWVKTHSLIFLI